MSPFADLDLKDSLVYLKIRFCLALQYIQEEDGCQKVQLNWFVNFRPKNDLKPKPEF